MSLLQNKVAFVTGGASGIGEGAARRFAQEGARVAIADVQDNDGRRVCDELIETGHEAIYVHCDVSDPASVERAINDTVKHFGRLDVVFANAGINGVWAPIEELQPEEWDRTQAINLKGTYLTIHFAVPHLKRAGGGSIIVTSSVNGTRVFSNPGAYAYSVTKAGQVVLVRMAALELGKHNIRCNAVCPGAIHTNIQESTEKRNTEKIGVKVEMPEGSPAVNAGQGEPRDVADVCLFLASDMGRHVSGVEIYVDGGESLVR